MELTPDKIRQGKEEAVNALAGVDIDTSNLNDEQIDQLIGQLSIKESINQIIESIEAINGDEEDIAEAISVHTGFKLDEAKSIYHDILRERKDENKLDRILEALN